MVSRRTLRLLLWLCLLASRDGHVLILCNLVGIGTVRLITSWTFVFGMYVYRRIVCYISIDR
jgi:hypothetical protein